MSYIYIWLIYAGAGGVICWLIDEGMTTVDYLIVLMHTAAVLFIHGLVFGVRHD